MELIVKEASEAQQSRADHETYSEWGAPHLTLEEYFEREGELYASEFAEEALTAYVMVPAADPDTLDFMSYLEVFKRPCLYNGQETYGYSIDAVFTPPSQRKNGYASILLEKLIAYLHEHDGVDVVISNLYSDIGPTFYGKHGWKVHSSKQLIFPTTTHMDGSTNEDTIVINHVNQLAQVCRDETQYMTELAKATPSSVYFPMSPELFVWFQVRSHYFARTKTSFGSVPTTYGVYCANDQGTATSYMLWTHDFEYDELTVLRCRADKDHFPAFLAAAFKEASQWKLGQVCIWDPPSWMEEAYASYFEIRADELPSLLVRKASTQHDVEDVVWLSNEKYCWV